MKQKELLKRLYEVQVHKSKLKQILERTIITTQEAYDKAHQIETSVHLLIQDLTKKKKS